MTTKQEIVNILMSRDKMSKMEAINLVKQAQEAFLVMVESETFNTDEADDFCFEWFRLEPDYLEAFI